MPWSIAPAAFWPGVIATAIVVIWAVTYAILYPRYRKREE